ncbi:MAG: response regulator [Chloroflexota bacterium]
MKTLIVEDDFTSRLLMQQMLKDFGQVLVAVDGQEAVEAVRLALQNGEPYDLICLDIMMPGLDGQQALTVIREMEADRDILPGQGVKIVMTTSLADLENKARAFVNQCDGYLTKPIYKRLLLAELDRLKLTSPHANDGIISSHASRDTGTISSHTDTGTISPQTDTGTISPQTDTGTIS